MAHLMIDPRLFLSRKGNFSIEHGIIASKLHLNKMNCPAGELNVAQNVVFQA